MEKPRARVRIGAKGRLVIPALMREAAKMNEVVLDASAMLARIQHGSGVELPAIATSEYPH